MPNNKYGVPAVCAECGSDFLKFRATVRFCSFSCRGKANRAKQDLNGVRNPRYNGGLSTSQGRTIIVTRDGGWMFYYRGVMAAHLGRLLEPDEIVHHVNGNPSDDRLENLQVMTRAEHLSVHRDELLAARKLAA